MGKYRYQKPETLGSLEIPQQLRKMKAKGSVVEDRFDSYVRRRMVDLDPGPHKKKKAVIKEKSQGQVAQELHETRLKQKQAAAEGKIQV